VHALAPTADRVRAVVLVLGVLTAGGSTLPAQETGTPVFHSPYRSFVSYEMGATASFRSGSQTGLEGLYRRAFGAVDAGLRLGVTIREDAQDSFLAGIDGRIPLIAEEQFPLRGALVTGIGFDVSGGVSFWLPIGLALGRRLNVEKSAVSIVPFVQPTGYVTSVTSSKFAAGLGAGVDIRMSGAFEVRVAGGVGSSGAPEGVAVTASWLR